MIAFWSQYKGYIIHGAAMLVLFLSPSVQQFLVQHAGYATAGGAAWGWLLHWATGK